MPTEEPETSPSSPHTPNPESSPALPLIQRTEKSPTPTASLDEAKLPGSCALRLENLEAQSSQGKKEPMQSIAQDICTTFTCIAKYAEAGKLEAQHTNVIDDVIKMIRDTDIKTRHRLEKQERRLRRERDWLRMKHIKVIREINEMSGVYQKKMRDLRDKVRDLNREVQQLRAERGLLMAKMRADAVDQDADADVDEKFEVDTQRV
ncbi:uncharacterized protein N7511_006982 [Penicillium nucicola]|uniref:uncharacterized protein n=1 Tax=Penicillium nucicola TaxID=1850975 RepID=UPI002545B097|nr:uncharacterized protein N7511_006982 [Penicillium nucicola]KAJ5758288.1 hypothetical protein N7511_006982 [Penicillium nucicola]